MKNLVLGIMMVATSVVFAQDATNIDRKDLKVVKHRPVAVKKDIQVREVVQDGPIRKMSILQTGVVRIVRGVAIIVLDERTNERVYPVNLPEKSKVDGMILQFTMRPSRAPMPEGIKVGKVVLLENLAVVVVRPK